MLFSTVLCPFYSSALIPRSTASCTAFAAFLLALSAFFPAEHIAYIQSAGYHGQYGPYKQQRKGNIIAYKIHGIIEMIYYGKCKKHTPKHYAAVRQYFSE